MEINAGNREPVGAGTSTSPPVREREGPSGGAATAADGGPRTETVMTQPKISKQARSCCTSLVMLSGLNLRARDEASMKKGTPRRGKNLFAEYFQPDPPNRIRIVGPAHRGPAQSPPDPTFARGSLTVKTDPFPIWLSTPMEPLWASTMSSQIASPRPVPPVLRPRSFWTR
jgi:hypothetical protein